MGWRPPGSSQQTSTSKAACCWARRRPGFQHHLSVALAAPLRQGGVSFPPLFGLPDASGDSDKKPGVYLSCLRFEACRQSQLQPRNNVLVQYICWGLDHVNTAVHLSSPLNISLYSSLNQKEQQPHNRGILHSYDFRLKSGKQAASCLSFICFRADAYPN